MVFKKHLLLITSYLSHECQHMYGAKSLLYKQESLLWAVLDLGCHTGLSLVAVCRLLFVAASLVAEHGL